MRRGKVSLHASYWFFNSPLSLTNTAIRLVKQITETRSTFLYFTSHKRSVGFVQGAFLKLSINSDLSFEVKLKQKIAVNCLLEGKDVFTVMPNCFGKIFFSCSTQRSRRRRFEKDLEGEYPNSVILVICPLIGLIEDLEIKEGQPLGLTCASLQDINDLFSEEKALYNDFKRILKDRSSKIAQQVGLIVIDKSHTVEIWTGKICR